jgi:hypothetical protein
MVVAAISQLEVLSSRQVPKDVLNGLPVCIIRIFEELKQSSYGKCDVRPDCHGGIHQATYSLPV